MGMRPGIIFCVLSALGTVVHSAQGGIQELAQAGQWERLLQVANRRAEQLPLAPREAFLAAHAAGITGDADARRRYLELVLEDGDLGGLAAVELAQLAVSEDPERALDLIVPMLRRAPSREVRAAAVGVACAAVASGVDEPHLATLTSAARSLPSSLRRTVELALAQVDETGGRGRLNRLLAASTSDQPALAAAGRLQTEGELTGRERYLVAKTLYRHALYDEAEALLSELDRLRSPDVPALEVAFLAGRCAFRKDRWSDAGAWYRKALAGTRSAEGRAELEVHLARTYELSGDLAAAVEAARRAVVARTTDDRRLFLARLRLRLDQPDKARAGIAKVRGRATREHGELMIGLYEFRRGDTGAARTRMEGVDLRPWRGPASVLAAGLARATGDFDGALVLLERYAPELGPFWADRARAVMAELPAERLAAWRTRCEKDLESGDARSRRRTLVKWITLENDAAILAGLRRAVIEQTGLGTKPGQPVFPRGLADDLWGAGLPTEAIRWDAAGMPLGDAGAALWTASSFRRLGAPWQAIRAADAAWRMAGSDVPTRGYPEELQRALHPLPYPELVWASAVEHAVPWALLAGVAREESRWDPTVVSRVGARGLMQLMPSTAAATARRAGQVPPPLDGLFDPAVSLRLGAAELSRLYGALNGQLAPVVAAYNAGEAQARLWNEQCGSPCPPAWYVANITFTATSGYAQDVLTAADVYLGLFGAAEPKPVEGR